MPLFLLQKSYVRAHTRRLKNGKQIHVGSYHNKVAARPKYKAAKGDDKTRDLFAIERKRPTRQPCMAARSFAKREAGSLEQAPNGGWRFALWDPDAREWEYNEEPNATRDAAQADRREFLSDRAREIDAKGTPPRPPEPLSDWRDRQEKAQYDPGQRMIERDRARSEHHPPQKPGLATDRTKPGYYVTVMNDKREHRPLAGPFAAHQHALDTVADAKDIATNLDPRASFYAYGTAKLADGQSEGILNGRLGLSARDMIAERMAQG